MHRALQPTERPRPPSQHPPCEADNRPAGIVPGMTRNGRILRAPQDGPLAESDPAEAKSIADRALGSFKGDAATPISRWWASTYPLEPTTSR